MFLQNIFEMCILDNKSRNTIPNKVMNERMNEINTKRTSNNFLFDIMNK